MSRLARVFQKQFGVNAGASDVGIFGSLAASNPQYSKDPETIQSLNAFLTGWAAETIANNRPALEDFNALDFLAFYQICYLFQAGVPEWDADTTYYEGSICQVAGVLYRSLDDDNIDNDPTTEADKWEEVIPNPTTGGVAGSYKNLKAVRASKTQVTVTADELVLENTDHEKVSVFGVNQSAAITSSGAGGLDTGTEANVWYYIWIIRKSSDGTVAALLSASATTPTLPAGYDQKALVSAVHNTSGDFVEFIQQGMDYFYTSGQSMVSGSTSWPNAVTVDTTSFVPSGISTHIFITAISQNGCAVANKSGITMNGYSSNLYRPQATAAQDWVEMNIITADTLWYAGGNTEDRLYCAGFRINKLS